MSKLYTDEQINKITEEYNWLTKYGLSKSKATEYLANQYYCHPSTVANYVKAWGRD